MLAYFQSLALRENVSREIGAMACRSMLDIGAGHPNTALSYSRLVPRYVAVEKDASRARRLARCGLNVVYANFPSPVTDQFDLVLCSHSIPNTGGHSQFIDAAWDCVADNGSLLVITFKGHNADLEAVRREITGKGPKSQVEVAGLVHQLRSLGSFSHRVFNSYAESQSRQELQNFVTRWLFPTDSVHFDESSLANILETRYKRGRRYVFPFQHLLFKCSRSLDTNPRLPH